MVPVLVLGGGRAQEVTFPLRAMYICAGPIAFLPLNNGRPAAQDRGTLLRTIEDFERTVAEFRWNNVVLSTGVLLRRLEEIGVSANELGDPVLIAMVEKLQRHLTTGKGLDG